MIPSMNMKLFWNTHTIKKSKEGKVKGSNNNKDKKCMFFYLSKKNQIIDT